MEQKPPRLRRIHHIEMWVGEASQASYFYRNAFGFSQFAYCGLETGNRQRTTHALEQGQARLLLTSSMDPDSEINDHVRRHGDGVKDIAFLVDDAEDAFAAAVGRGAEAATEPQVVEDSHGQVKTASVKTYGETVHSFISHHGYDGPFMPGFEAWPIAAPDAGLLRFDHVVGNVELGKMETWANWYSDVLGFRRLLKFDQDQISTEYSALMSIVMSDGSYAIKFPINEPAQGRKKSQIEEYLDFYGGAGVQHIAMLTRDIVKTVNHLRQQGVDFLTVPDSYYDELPDRIGEIDESYDSLRPLGILADRDDEGYLLQLFTKPVVNRPTLFFEIIQRKGSRGFGEGNFKALFEAIEREQEVRGNL